MAAMQEGVLQQPPEPAQPGQAANLASAAQPAPQSASNNQATPSASPTQESVGNNAAQGQVPGPELDFSKILEQQISQAIQPVLNEFRQNVAQTMEQQAAALPSHAGEGMAGAAGAPQAMQATAQGPGAQQQPVQQPQQPMQQQGGPAVTQQPPVQQALGQATQPVQGQLPPQAQQLAQPAEIAGQTIGQVESQAQQAPQGAVAGALRPALETVEHQGKQWLQSLLVAGLAALLAESTHAAVQQRAEHGLHTLLQKLFEAAPEGVTNQEMQIKTERTLQMILRESLDAVFVGGMRATVQQGGQLAIQDSLQGNFGSALGRVEDTLKAMAEALIEVLRRQWQNVLRLLLALVLLALESSLAQSSTEKKGARGQSAAAQPA